MDVFKLTWTGRRYNKSITYMDNDIIKYNYTDKAITENNINTFDLI